MSEYAEQFYSLILIFRNKDAVYMEYTAIEQIIFITLKYVCVTFSKYFGIIEVRHLPPNFFRHLSPSSGQDAAPLPNCRTERRTWRLRSLNVR